VVNALEFDLVNSFHTHANFFDYYPTGTRVCLVNWLDFCWFVLQVNPSVHNKTMESSGTTRSIGANC
jgi:hypothetical protein